jgi:CubicO group peptidase (beta-lactamase class C family)
MSQRVKEIAIPAIEDMMSISGTPGLSLVVSCGGEDHISHLGFRDLERRLRANDETRFNINSMTKGFVSLLTGIEVQKNTVGWSTTIKEALPEFRSMDPIVEENATIVDMLSHRTGITNFDSPWLQSHNSILLNLDQITKTFATLKPCLQFRTSFLYNNWGYELVGEILKSKTGCTLSQLLQHSIFEPLGLTRTSTSWDLEDENNAKSYAVLDDLTSIEIPPPQLGKGTLMEAAGGVKSSMEDLLVFYKALLKAIQDQFANSSDETPGSIFKQCRAIIANHARFPGSALREQGYGAGFARSQLPGQLGRISLNPLIGDEPIVGKGATSKLVIYHHGSMPGSTSCVLMIPETDTIIIVLQNSLAPLDTADFVGQLLVETVCDVPQPNDYRNLTREFVEKSLSHMSRLKSELDGRRKLHTRPRELKAYVSQYWNGVKNFCIEITEHSGRLQMSFQGSDDEIYVLDHYEDDTFTWWMPYNDAARRGRYVTDFGASYYLVTFDSQGTSGINTLKWAWDPNMPDQKELFTSTKTGSKSSVSPCCAPSAVLR